MYLWIILAFVFVVALFVLQPISEGFTTLDTNTALAQRQQQQFEGERQYNPLARLEDPNTKISPDLMDQAIRQTIPVSTSKSDTLLSLIGSSGGLGASDDGSNKQGSWLEQTGVIQDKINFCESQPVSCDAFGSPQMAECGFCHKGGKNSKGQKHRGGMYISSDDQIRANQTASAAGVPAKYKPTVGSCPEENFTLMPQNCQARELALECMSQSAPSALNNCAQCYGSPGADLLYVGPKPRAFTCFLNVSHPGGHSNGGHGTIIQYPNGYQYKLAYSSKKLFDPQPIAINVYEGLPLTIIVYGMPSVWCAWLSDQSGKRTVGINLGQQSINNGFIVVGDKRSGTITKAAAKYDKDVWASYKNTVPNGVMWYGRRDEVVPGMVVGAWYGTTLPTSQNPNGSDVTDFVKRAAGSNLNIPVNLTVLGVADPYPGVAKNLFITYDNKKTISASDGETIPANKIYNALTVGLRVPATLVDPVFEADVGSCPTGPLIFSEIGAGLMGSHSCFKPDGSFNPTVDCLQDLFIAAGGTEKGRLWPNSVAAGATIIQKDANGKPDLGATTTWLNNKGSIATYGITSNDAQVSFDQYLAESMDMLGTVPRNPCDGPNATNGPHSPECLDYLWKTSGASDSGKVNDPSRVPYRYCGKVGTAAPLNMDGSPNQANIDKANSLGPLPAVRAYYTSIYNNARDSDNFDNSVKGMKECYNVDVPRPKNDTTLCSKDLGCYYDHWNRVLKGPSPGRGHNKASCEYVAQYFNQKYFSIQDGNECYTGNNKYDIYGKAPGACPPGGRPWVAHTWETGQKYKDLGCFVDRHDRALKGPYGGRNHNKTTCGALAASKNQKYFSVQDGNECYTGNDGFDKYGKATGDCPPGGGPWKAHTYEVP
jgi:hypothetical protein